MSRRKIRRIQCDGLVASAFTEVLVDPVTDEIVAEGGVRRGDPISCTAVFDVVGSLDWEVIDQRARAAGWTLRGPVQGRTHYCPKHKTRGA